MHFIRSATVTVATVAVGLALGACGDDDDSPAPTGPLAEALAATGGGGAHGSLGVGWVGPELLSERGLQPEVASAALAPNAGSVVDSARQLRRRFGLDPMSAERLVSVGGSYAFGLRLDGPDGRRLGHALVEAGGRSRADGELDLITTGAYAVVPEPLLDAGVRGLGAYDAVGPDVIVMAISDRALNSLLGEGDRLLDEPIYRAATRCLGDVAAARMVPDKLLISTEQGVELVAIGVREPDDEVLCVLGGTAERSAEVATNLEAALPPGAPDSVSASSVGESIARAEVTHTSYEGVEVARADVTLARGEAPGYLFTTISGGSLVGLLNGTDAGFTRHHDLEALARGEHGDP